MSNILILDTLGERYGMLPSEVLARSSTLDLFVLDAATTWHNYQSNKAQGKYADQYTTEDMASMLEKARQQNG